MPRTRYYYDAETCSFVAVKPSRAGLYRRAALTLVLGLLMATGWYVADLSETPQELALLAQNAMLQQQLDQVQARMEAFSTQLSSFSTSDESLYRTLLEVDPISNDVRQVGMGGTESYAEADRYGTKTATLLRTSHEMLARIEQQIALQHTSYEELSQLVMERDERLVQLPALMPANGPLTSGYGMRRHPILRIRKMHRGIDVLIRTGTPVVATADGVIKEARYNGGYGKCVVIEHPATGYSTLYAHLSKIPDHIKPGQTVKRGEQIGLSGSTGRSTGPHLHYEVHDADGRTVNPIHFIMQGMTPDQYKALVEAAEDVNAYPMS